MQYSFGDEIKQFAHAVDVIDEEGLRRFRDIIDRYTKETLNIVYTSLYFDAEDQQGNITLIPYRLAKRHVIKGQPIKTSEGKFTSHIAYAYEKEVKLWVTCSKDSTSKLLSKCSTYRDHWSGKRDLPPYQSPLNEEIRTSIIVPVRNEEERVFGVLNFETTEFLDITEIAKRELKTISESVAIIYRTSVQSEYQRTQTKFALDQLTDHARQPWPKLSKPKIFIASSARSPQEIVQCITKLLQSEYSDKLEPIYWKDMSGSGNINFQLLTTLASCRFGICYFSELTTNVGVKYEDNSNVVFEAGMLHGRSDMGSPRPASWIPVREQDSSESPFDFAHERTILVPRDKQNDEKLNCEEFEKLLRRQLNALLS